MVHSHIPVKHLLKQVELYRTHRPGRKLRPEWVTEFIEQAADLFDPFSEVGRVGFDCRLADDRWVVGLYLGSLEIVGGPEDGADRPAGFRFDLQGLMELFSEVEAFGWQAPDTAEQGSRVTLDGRRGEHPLRVEIYAVPPADAGPGLRQYPDGRCDPV